MGYYPVSDNPRLHSDACHKTEAALTFATWEIHPLHDKNSTFISIWHYPRSPWISVLLQTRPVDGLAGILGSEPMVWVYATVVHVFICLILKQPTSPTISYTYYYSVLSSNFTLGLIVCLKKNISVDTTEQPEWDWGKLPALVFLPL